MCGGLSRALLLKFSTGRLRLPCPLEVIVEGDTNMYPTAHTCFFQIGAPPPPAPIPPLVAPSSPAAAHLHLPPLDPSAAARAALRPANCDGTDSCGRRQ